MNIFLYTRYFTFLEEENGRLWPTIATKHFCEVHIIVFNFDVYYIYNYTITINII